MSDLGTPIQLAPPGLLGLPQLKTAGINPDALQRQISPTIDLEAWWLRASARKAAATLLDLAPATYAAVQGFATLTVPNTAWWYVRNYTVRLQGQAALAVITRFALAYKVPTSAGSPDGDYLLQDLLFGSVTEPAMCALSAKNFWLPPGAQLGLWVDTVTVNTFRVLLTGLDYTELPL